MLFIIMRFNTIFRACLFLTGVCSSLANPQQQLLPAPDNSTKDQGQGAFNTAYAGFKKTWEVRQADFLKDQAKFSGVAAVVLLGDSITQGAPGNKLGLQLPVANRGISGDTSRGMLYRLEHNVISLKPSAVVLLCGTNDLIQPGGSPQSLVANMQAITAALEKHNKHIKLVVCTMLPIAEQRDKNASQKVAEVNALIREKFQNGNRLQLCDLHAAFVDEAGAIKSGVLRDGVHPNARGYELWKTALLESLQKLELR